MQMYNSSENGKLKRTYNNFSTAVKAKIMRQRSQKCDTKLPLVLIHSFSN